MSSEQLQRRYSDHVEHTSDHDLLIKVNTKVTTICSTIADTNSTLREYIEKMDRKCGERTDHCVDKFDKKLDSNTFWRLVAILVLLFSASFAGFGANRLILARHTEKIAINAEHIDLRLKKVLPSSIDSTGMFIPSKDK